MTRNVVGRRVLFIAFLVSLAFLAISSAILYRYEYGRRMAAVEVEVRTLYEAQAPGIAEALWNFDVDLLRILIDDLGFYPYIDYVAVKATDGSLVESGESDTRNPLRSFSLTRTRPGRDITNLGELLLRIDSRKIRADVLEQVVISLAFQAAFLAVVSAILLLLFSRMVTRHLTRIASHIEEFGVKPVALPLVLDKRDVGDELDVLVRSFNAMHVNLDAARAAELRAMDDLSRSLREKETLLQEIYHRTKNNMQLISSFLSMEAGSSKDERVVFMLNEMIGRITSMALVHKKLYESKDLSRIDFAEYLEELVGEIRRAYLADSSQVRIDVDAEAGIIMLLDAAVPCGIAINELIVNAVKHAFSGGRRGTIRVGLSRAASGSIVFSVIDNGVGFPPGFDALTDGRIGLQTVVSIVESQLRGAISFGAGPGVSCFATIRSDFFSARI